MKYTEVHSQSVAKGTLRAILLEIHSTKHHRGIVGFSVRMQRLYSTLWLPVGKRLLYGRNAWDFTTKNAAIEYIQQLSKKMNGGKK